MAKNRRRVKPLPLSTLEGLTTERLLAYRERLYSLEPLEWSDIDKSKLDELEPGYIYFQDSPEWRLLYAAIKSILGEREHIAK